MSALSFLKLIATSMDDSFVEAYPKMPVILNTDSFDWRWFNSYYSIGEAAVCNRKVFGSGASDSSSVSLKRSYFNCWYYHIVFLNLKSDLLNSVPPFLSMLLSYYSNYVNYGHQQLELFIIVMQEPDLSIWVAMIKYLVNSLRIICWNVDFVVMTLTRPLHA